jgi:hypothetical protein
MKTVTLIGIFLIVFGAFIFAYQGIPYVKRETIVDLGPIEATTETRKTLPVPRILGGLSLIGGVALVVSGFKK